MTFNYTHLEGCTCFVNPPCSFCVNTFECEVCNSRKYTEESKEDSKYGIICFECDTSLKEQEMLELLKESIAIVDWYMENCSSNDSTTFFNLGANYIENAKVLIQKSKDI